jgi:hypothetical protein
MEVFMKKIVFLAIVGFLVVTTGPLIAKTVDVSGQWLLTLDLEGQATVLNLTFEQAGEKLIVKWKRTDANGKEENAKAEGTVKGNKIKWTEIGNLGLGDVEVVWTGTVEDDKISGETDFGGNVTYFWEAVKKI